MITARSIISDHQYGQNSLIKKLLDKYCNGTIEEGRVTTHFVERYLQRVDSATELSKLLSSLFRNNLCELLYLTRVMEDTHNLIIKNETLVLVVKRTVDNHGKYRLIFTTAFKRKQTNQLSVGIYHTLEV